MEALSALASVSMQISEARNVLFELQSTETEYLVSREKKAVKQIEKIVSESSGLFNEAQKNYALVNDFAKEVTECATKLNELYADFTNLVAKKEQKLALIEDSIKNQMEVLENTKKAMRVEMEGVAGQKNVIEKMKKAIDVENKKLTDQRGTLDRAIKRLKEGRI